MALVKANDQGNFERRQTTDLESVKIVIDFAYNDMEISSSRGEKREEIFSADKHAIVIDAGDDAVTLSVDMKYPYLNRPAFLDQVVHFLYDEADIYLQTIHLVVVGIRRDLVQWAQQRVRLAVTQKHRMEPPWFVVRLGEDPNGRLDYVEYTHADYPVRSEWQYIPSDPDDGFFYVVFTDGSPRLRTLNSVRRFMGERKLVGNDVMTLASKYWDLMRDVKHIEEALLNTQHAEHVLSHPQPVLTTREIREITPAHLLTDRDLITMDRGGGVAQVQNKQAQRASFMQLVQHQQVLQYVRQRYEHELKIRRNGPPPPRRAMAAHYDRPEPFNDIYLVPPELNLAASAAPTYNLDPDALKANYRLKVSIMLGFLSPHDAVVLPKNTATANQSKLGGESGGGGGGGAESTSKGMMGGDSASRKRMRFRRDRALYSDLYKFVYDLSLAAIDMEALVAIMDGYTEEMRMHVSLILDPPPSANDLFKKTRRQPALLKEVLQKLLGDRKTDALSLKERIIARISAGHYISTRFVFGVDLAAIEEDMNSSSASIYRPHERNVDPETQQHRKDLWGAAHSAIPTGVFSRDEVRGMFAEYFDADVHGPAPPVPIPVETKAKKKKEKTPAKKAKKKAKKKEKKKEKTKKRARAKEDEDDEDEPAKKKRKKKKKEKEDESD